MIKKTFIKNVVATLVCLALIASVFIMPVSAATEPGTAVQEAVVRTASVAYTSSTSLSPIVTETGKISLSVDGLGTDGTGTIQVEKPAGATVRSAYMFAAGLWGYSQIADGQITLDDQAVNWDYYTYKNAYNYWADVTPLVESKINNAPAGTIDLTVVETYSSYNIDGTILVVIFDDPNQTTDNTVVLLFGAQSTSGDTFNLLLADPIDKSVPDMSFDMGLGISYSYQSGSSQYSIVDVNGQRVTTAAGGEDDGYSSNGGLITVGGLGDSNANPADPNAKPTKPTSDDELYNILPFVNDGDDTITVYTQNPSNDDNIFFAYFNLKSTTAIVGEGILLSPSSATATVGDKHAVIATVQDDAGNPMESRNVTFTITSGPHAGLSTSAYTGSDGKATFTYTGTAAGTDVIEASFIDNQQAVITSNEVTCIWEESGNNNNNNEIPEFPTIALPIAAIIGLAFVFHSRKEE
nr:Ig-like domain-containing protein [uncultured Methanolobus sp.]